MTPQSKWRWASSAVRWCDRATGAAWAIAELQGRAILRRGPPPGKPAVRPRGMLIRRRKHEGCERLASVVVLRRSLRQMKLFRRGPDDRVHPVARRDRVTVVEGCSNAGANVSAHRQYLSV